MTRMPTRSLRARRSTREQPPLRRSSAASPHGRPAAISRRGQASPSTCRLRASLHVPAPRDRRPTPEWSRYRPVQHLATQAASPAAPRTAAHLVSHRTARQHAHHRTTASRFSARCVVLTFDGPPWRPSTPRPQRPVGDLAVRDHQFVSLAHLPNWLPIPREIVRTHSFERCMG
jgi:hypothetical protein